MIAPTIERRFPGGSGLLPVLDRRYDVAQGQRKAEDQNAAHQGFFWNRGTYLQRFFDNLIANEDRSQGNMLITADWRMILIDHSRRFRTWKKLIYTEKHPEGPKLMKELPRRLSRKPRR